jgi:NitT/TauT family transport system substrate-binding protein
MTLLRFFLVLIALGLAACQPPAPPLRVASSPWPGYESLYLARDLGLFDDSHVQLSELPSSNVTLESFNNGGTDIATLTLDETLTLLGQGRKLRILAVMDISNGADAVMAQASIKRLAELKGTRIAITNIPLGFYMLARTLEAAGLQANEVQVLPLPENKHEQAFREGRVDAAITFEPFKTRLQAAGAHPLFDSRQIPNEIFDLLVVREEVYLTRRAELCRLVSQWYQALDHIQANPEDSAARMGKRLNMATADFQASLSGLVLPSRELSRELLGNGAGGSPRLLKPAQDLMAVMLRAGMLGSAVLPASAIDPSFQTCVQ